MNPQEARAVLQLYRPGTADSEDLQVIEALEVARQDKELAAWLERHIAFQTAMRIKFRELPVPNDLKEKLLKANKVVRVSWWHNPALLKIAAAIITVATLSLVLFSAARSRTPDRFADYEQRMVRSALREYRMDLVTNDLQQVRELMASKGAPADFSIPKRLADLELTGGGVLRWRNHPVSMVCYNRGDNQMLFLFIMDRAAVKDPPSTTIEVQKVSKLATASWSEGNKTYLLAGPEDSALVEKYF